MTKLTFKQLSIVLLLLLSPLIFPLSDSSSAQGQYGWCGYALIEGIPLLENQLAVFEAITPAKSTSINPFQLFQYRFNLNHSAVIIEACWGVPPSRPIVAALLAQVIPPSPALIQAVLQYQAAQIAAADVGLPLLTEIAPTATPTLDPQQAVALYIDENLTLTIFAPGGTHEESAAGARAYLIANAVEWELPDS